MAGFFAAFGKALSVAAKAAAKAAAATGKAAGKAAGTAGKVAGKTLAQVGKGAGQTLQTIGKGAGQGLQAVGKGAGQGLSSVGKGVGNLLEGAGNVAQNAGSRVVDVAGDAGEKLVDIIGDGLTQVTGLGGGEQPVATAGTEAASAAGKSGGFDKAKIFQQLLGGGGGGGDGGGQSNDQIDTLRAIAAAMQADNPTFQSRDLGNGFTADVETPSGVRLQKALGASLSDVANQRFENRERGDLAQRDRLSDERAASRSISVQDRIDARAKAAESARLKRSTDAEQARVETELGNRVDRFDRGMIVARELGVPAEILDRPGLGLEELEGQIEAAKIRESRSFRDGSQKAQSRADESTLILELQQQFPDMTPLQVAAIKANFRAGKTKEEIVSMLGDTGTGLGSVDDLKSFLQRSITDVINKHAE